MTKNTLSIFLISFIVIITSTIVLIKTLANSETELNIVKSNWPIWDAFEYTQEKHLSNVTFKNVDHYSQIITSINESSIDGGLSTIYEVIKIKDSGVPIKIIGILDYTIGADSLVAKTSISHITKLKNKKIGAEYGTISHFTALKALEKSGLSPNDVTFIFKPMNELIIDYKNDKIDAISTYEPFASNLLSNKKTSHIVFSSKDIPRTICDVFFVKENILKSHPKTIKKMMENWNKTATQLKTKDKNLINKINKFYKTKNRPFNFDTTGIYITNSIDNNFALKQNGYLEKALEKMKKFMKKQKVIKKHIPIETLVIRNET